MAHMATDVVLLPDKTMTDKAIELNRQIVRECSTKIVLNERDCLPHISLAMGCLDERDVSKIRQILERLASEIPIRQLTATGIQTPTNSRGEETSLLMIERTQELQRLHERVMEKTRPFFGHDGKHAVFHDDVVAESAKDWVSDYPQKTAYEHFSPHITLGYGQAKVEFSFPAVFTASGLALCHLGNHCTCRKVLCAIGL